MEALPAGTKLKSWVVRRLIGRGAFGFVYEAVSSQVESAEPVALKVALRYDTGASKSKKPTQSSEAALLFKEYNLYSGARMEIAWVGGSPYPHILGRAPSPLLLHAFRCATTHYCSPLAKSTLSTHSSATEERIWGR